MHVRNKTIAQKRFNPFILLLAAIIPVTVFMSACNIIPRRSKEKEFSKAGMTIVLTEAFAEKEYASLTAYYESPKSIVTVLKEEFTYFESENISLEEYANIVLENNSLISEIEEMEGLTCFEYEREINGKDLTYFATVFKGDDAFWLIQFACETKNYNDFSDTFVTWAKSVEV